MCPPVEQCHYALQKEQKEYFPMNGRISRRGGFFPFEPADLLIRFQVVASFRLSMRFHGDANDANATPTLFCSVGNATNMWKPTKRMKRQENSLAVCASGWFT